MTDSASPSSLPLSGDDISALHPHVDVERHTEDGEDVIFVGECSQVKKCLARCQVRLNVYEANLAVFRCAAQTSMLCPSLHDPEFEAESTLVVCQHRSL